MKELELTCRVGKEISEDELRSAAAKALGVGVKSVGECRLVRRSVDARGDVIYRLRYQVCTAAVLKTTRFLNITTSTMQSR